MTKGIIVKTMVLFSVQKRNYVEGVLKNRRKAIHRFVGKCSTKTLSWIADYGEI